MNFADMFSPNMSIGDSPKRTSAALDSDCELSPKCFVTQHYGDNSQSGDNYTRLNSFQCFILR